MARYTSLNAMYITEQTSGTKIEIADFDIRNWYWRLEYDSPVAKKREVYANFSPTLKGFRKRVHFFRLWVSHDAPIHRMFRC